MTSSHLKPLAKNESLVFSVLERAKVPMSAYAILDQLQPEGFRSPPQVYRALDKLIQSGLVHRLETISAFVACRHPECDRHQCVVFMICENCDFVEERSDVSLIRSLNRIAGTSSFEPHNASIEITGT